MCWSRDGQDAPPPAPNDAGRQSHVLMWLSAVTVNRNDTASVCPLVTKLLSRCDEGSRNQLVLRVAAKLPPKPTATGETRQSCRLGKEGVAVPADDNDSCGDSN